MQSNLKRIMWLGLSFSACAALLYGCGSSGGSSVSSVSSSSLSSPISSSSSSDSSGCATLSSGNGYCLVWQDEFQADQVDDSKWSFEKNCYGGGNNEAQCYVDSSNNVWVDGEFLHIKAIRESLVGPGMLDDDPSYSASDISGSGDYSSGRLRTKGKGDWRFGRFEIRAKLPSGQGSWPAIWMLPTNSPYGGWAASGEIDIMEAVNLKVGGESRVHGTLHFGNNWPDNVYSGEAYTLPGGANPADDFHVYAVEWELGEIRWYVDGDHFATQTQDGWYSVAALDNPAAPYDQPFHLILNLAVGGDWAANVNDTGIDASAFPQEMVVDYVRVFECSQDPETGKGCATRDESYVTNPGHQPPQVVDVEQGNDLAIFTDSVHAPFDWFYWTESGDVGYALENVGGDYGTVAQLSFNTDAGIGFFQSPAGTDMTPFAAIEFDLRVVADPRATKSNLVFRADCTYPCTSGDYDIGYPAQNVWTHYRIPLADLATRGLNLSQVNTPFVISPTFGNERGVVLQVDNIRMVRN